MDNPEKLATQDTHNEGKQNRNTTQSVLDTAMRIQTQTTRAGNAPSYKQLEAKKNRPPFVCGHRNGHHSTELRT